MKNIFMKDNVVSKLPGKKVALLGLITPFLLSACDNTNSHLNGLSKAEVCKAAITYLSSMKNDINEAVDKGDMVRINQIRASDKKRFYYDCKIYGNSIIWRMNQADGSMGRWRDSSQDPKVTYSVSGGKVHIEESY